MSTSLLWPTDKIRTTYLEFFRSQGHKIVPSDSLIPGQDPTLLFTGAGMNQFKDYFLGVRRDMKRAASSQKCLRTGDLDLVGKTPYHHSFFEMLGNFSFGDYFKQEAIVWAMELLEMRYKIPRERIRVSVHRDDQEAYKIWADEIKIRADWIKKLGDHTNFWPADAIQQGPSGPCGPCTEIFYDQGKEFGCGRSDCDVDCDCGRFAEFWNLVFTQFDRQEGGECIPLATKNIDTGAGLERLACILQGRKSNFEIDILRPLVDCVEKQAGGIPRAQNQDRLRVARTVADHARAATFAVADGVTPSNEGRGYVVRKLIRRALWQGRKFLYGQKLAKPFLFEVAPFVAEIMNHPYPYLKNEISSVQMVIRGEEERFLDTLADGQRILDEMIHKAKQSGHEIISAEDAFKLYDTYGFPDELTVSIAEEYRLRVDVNGFQTLMENQRKKAKEASKMTRSIFVASELNPNLMEQVPSIFLGYETLSAEGTVLFLDLKGKEGWALLDQTPFYAEKGGQVGDCGAWTWPRGQARVVDTQWKDNRWILHRIKVEEGHLIKGMKVRAQVDEDLRERTRRHHTATHLLQSALRRILGAHVRQLGSLVSPEKLRFDFSHPNSLSSKEIKDIENFVNSAILSNLLVATEIKTFAESQSEGVLAFFGEKYDEKVRVLNVGNGLSKELCGGTHVRQTGDIGSFLILSEASIASGTRRIEAVAGIAAVEYLQETRDQLQKLASILKTSPAELVNRVEKIQEKNKDREKKTGAQITREQVESIVKQSRDIKGIRFVQHDFKDLDVSSLRGIADQIRIMNRGKEVVAVLFSVSQDAVNFVTASTSHLVDASSLTKKIAAILEGSGGGKKDFAQGGSKRPELVPAVQGALHHLLSEVLRG